MTSKETSDNRLLPLDSTRSTSPADAAKVPGMVWVVDDEAMVTSSLEAMLSLETPHTIVCFNDPREALKQLEMLHTQQQPLPEVVVSDFLMPGMSGIAFLKQVQQLAPETTRILLTGYADKENAIAAINEAGIYRYLEKPWDNTTLKMTLDQAIERTRLLQDITQRKAIERLREDFVATLTHDLRTPLLAAVRTLGFFVEGTVGALTDKQTELLTILRQSQQDLLDMVNTLLDVYRYESGKQQLVVSEIDLNKLLEQIMQELTGLASERGFELQLNLKEALSLKGDRQALRRVLTNLVANAIYHSGRSCTISVVVERLPQGVLMRVQDEGQGIPKADLPHLFQRFSQGTTRKRNSGSGLGLYLSRQIMEAHQGSITVHSEEGVGTRFELFLPQ